MHNNIVKFFKKISFFSTNPDHDWRVMFTILIIIAALCLSWNVYFFKKVRGEIESSEISRPRNLSAASNEQEDQLKKTIAAFEVKSKRNKATLDPAWVFSYGSSTTRLEDPSKS